MRENPMSEHHKLHRQADFAKTQYGRGRLGCIGALFFGVIVVILLMLALYPWAFRIGGQLTPLTVWTGYGRLHSASGANSALYVRLVFHMPRGRGGSNLRGSALLCTPQGRTYSYNLSGSVLKAWQSTEGKTTVLYLAGPQEDKSNRGFELRGVWRGGSLEMDDRGTMRRWFLPDGSLSPTNLPTHLLKPSDLAQTTLSFGSKEDFETLCKSPAADGK
jgi:hypothetical protein